MLYNDDYHYNICTDKLRERGLNGCLTSIELERIRRVSLKSSALCLDECTLYYEINSIVKDGMLRAVSEINRKAKENLDDGIDIWIEFNIETNQSCKINNCYAIRFIFELVINIKRNNSPEIAHSIQTEVLSKIEMDSDGIYINPIERELIMGEGKGKYIILYDMADGGLRFVELKEVMDIDQMLVTCDTIINAIRNGIDRHKEAKSAYPVLDLYNMETSGYYYQDMVENHYIALINCAIGSMVGELMN